MTQYLRLPAADLLNHLASTAPGPAGGSAGALTGAVAAALVEMVAALTVEKATAGSARLQDRYGPFRVRAQQIAQSAGELRQELQSLVQQDADLVEAALAQRRQSAAANEAERAAKGIGEDVLMPLRIARASLHVAEQAIELSLSGYQSAAADSVAAARLALAAAECGVAVAAANLQPRQDDPELKPVRDECVALLDRISMLRQ
jgi:formiminotetrahydrofolate cyclodeaminase